MTPGYPAAEVITGRLGGPAASSRSEDRVDVDDVPVEQVGHQSSCASRRAGDVDVVGDDEAARPAAARRR